MFEQRDRIIQIIMRDLNFRNCSIEVHALDLKDKHTLSIREIRETSMMHKTYARLRVPLNSLARFVLPRSFTSIIVQRANHSSFKRVYSSLLAI